MKEELILLERERELTADKLSNIDNQIEFYRNNINRIEDNLKLSLESVDIKTKVFIYKYTYKYSLKDIAKLTNYSLVYIKKISAELARECRSNQ